MKLSIQEIVGAKKEWFATWFDSQFYHKLYAHRTDKEAAAFVSEIIRALQPLPNCRMLDLGCGNGRHARHFATKGFRVTGLDLAFSSIREAKKSENDRLRFYKHDMREPFGKNDFDYVFNFFTSFGYFSAEENSRVMQNIANALKENGFVLIDFMNAGFVEKHLIPYEEKEIDAIVYRITRWADEKFIHKKIEIDTMQTRESFSYSERVTKLSVTDFYEMFARSGLEPLNVYGDYQLNGYDDGMSSRCILLARKVDRRRLISPI